MINVTNLNTRWLGKSGETPHPALWHMLDVAAVAQQIQQHRPVNSDPNVCDMVTALIGLHDLGKVSKSFQSMLMGGGPQADQFKHWRVSGYYFKELADKIELCFGASYEALQSVLTAISCHHGRFDNAVPNLQRTHTSLGVGAFDDAERIIDLFSLLFPNAGFDTDYWNEDDIEDWCIDVSWSVSGLVTQADWIGSNPEWFPPAMPDIPLADYWTRSQDLAKSAVAQAGLFGARPNPTGQIIAPECMRPMQLAVHDVILSDTPTLFVIEDMTGAGKTEAALMLSKRLIDAGRGAGVFFALPSMATSNAIYERIQPIVAQIFDGNPQTALTHSKAALNTIFTAAQNDTTDTDTTCSAWLSDGRRRVLFADVAVGTIDQALMAVLHTRFNTLRQWALSNKIIIVDEAHSYDPYMQAELEALLRFHCHFGGTAIVMTASLPTEMKYSLLKTYGSVSDDLPLDYPQLTAVKSSKTTQVAMTQAVDPVPDNIRRVGIKRLPSTDSVFETIQAAVDQGACVAWVRNAVDDAIAAVTQLHNMGIGAELLHSRFTMGDRLQIEDRLQTTFGRHSIGRTGRVVVATQVIEQSLDLDFDVMISDLAPIGALIQRAGRLWRHRDRTRRPVDKPIMHILSPDPTDVTSDRWLSDVLDRGAYVYPVALQWRSAQAIFATGVLDEPANLRELIDTVHGAEFPVPKVLQAKENEQIGQDLAAKGRGAANVLNPTKGINQLQSLSPDDQHTPTRLGEPQTTLCLGRWDGAEWTPLVQSWPMSEVSIATKKWLPVAPSDHGTTPPHLSKFVTLVHVAQDGHIAADWYYDPTVGLHQK